LARGRSFLACYTLLSPTKTKLSRTRSRRPDWEHTERETKSTKPDPRHTTARPRKAHGDGGRKHQQKNEELFFCEGRKIKNLTGNKSKAVVDEAHNWEQYRKYLISGVRTRSTQQNAKTKFPLHFK
jgi:hypothetical protein